MIQYLGQIEINDWYNNQLARIDKYNLNKEVGYYLDYLKNQPYYTEDTSIRIKFINESEMYEMLPTLVRGDFYDN